MRTLAAASCTLEPQTAAHAGEMYGVLCDPAIYAFENAPPASQAWLAERFARLESRGSGDGAQLWLNWVVRLPGGALAGYVQATVDRSGTALVAYVMASRHWGRGLGSCAVCAMLDELRSAYQVQHFVAVLKRANARSMNLLRHLGFEPGSPQQAAAHGAGPDEAVMVRPAAAPEPA